MSGDGTWPDPSEPRSDQASGGSDAEIRPDDQAIEPDRGPPEESAPSTTDSDPSAGRAGADASGGTGAVGEATPAEAGGEPAGVVPEVDSHAPDTEPSPAGDASVTIETFDPPLTISVPGTNGGSEGPSRIPDSGPPAGEADGDPAPRPFPRLFAVANQKGGVGKTTTSVNLGAALAEIGYRVLVVDLDPQGNATTGLGINNRSVQNSIYDVLLADMPLEDVIEPTTVKNLFVAPANIDLAGAEIELVPAFSRELRLRRALETVESEYDFVVMDCPPSLGLLTVNALAAAGEVVVPIQCEYYALEGLGQLIRNVQLVQRNLNPRLELSTIILTMYDARTKLAEQVAQEVRDHFGAAVCRNTIPRAVRLSEAPSFGQPITVFDPTSRGAVAYRELAKEVSGGAPQRAR